MMKNPTPQFNFPPGLFNWQYWLDDDTVISSLTYIAPNSIALTNGGSRRAKTARNTGLRRIIYVL
jgi:hypothetical protein